MDWSQKRSPTPRQLKQFVNQIGAIRRQRSDVSLVHVGYYVLLRRDGVDVRAGLIEAELPARPLVHLFESQVRDDLAALHFGADHAQAQQLLMGPELERAFAGGGVPAPVAQLKDRAGFVDTLDTLDFPSRAADGGVELTRAVAVLSAAGAFDVGSVQNWAADVISSVWARAANAWRLDGAATGVGLALLAHRVSEGSATELAEFISSIDPDPADADEDGRQQSDGVAALVEELVRLGYSDAGVQVRFDIPPERLVPSLAYLAQQIRHNSARSLVAIPAKPPELANAIVSAADSDSASSVEAALGFSLADPKRIAMGEVATRAASALQDHDPEGRDQLRALLFLLDRSRRTPAAEQALQEGATDAGSLMQAVYFALSNGWYREAATASMLHLALPPRSSRAPTYPIVSEWNSAASRQALADPSTQPDLVAAQHDWLVTHKREAFGILGSVSAQAPDARAWVDKQIRDLLPGGRTLLNDTQPICPKLEGTPPDPSGRRV